ncbi:MAG TPA: SH3 domain-containing protein [Anaerolineales bacterium]|nr:SH3 domain-containing protein [Anaerolineales bacterium]
MKNVAEFLRNPTEFFKHEHNQKSLILSVFVLLFLCFLILLTNRPSRYSAEAANIDLPAVTAESIPPTSTPTKWWIRRAATFSPAPLALVTPSAIAKLATNKCPARLSSPIKTDIYAYIALAPPLPNRVRAGAGLSNNYLGQIEPGNGLKIIGGPICADGYWWWLVEALQDGIRGWTVEGKSSEQWIRPCPNEHIACHKAMATVSATKKSMKDKQQSNCQSDKFAIGILAQVGQENLLVLRSEPYTGGVNGRAGPMSIVKVIDGPSCAGGAVWWKIYVLDLDLVGWATESNFRACPKDSSCNLNQE